MEERNETLMVGKYTEIDNAILRENFLTYLNFRLVDEITMEEFSAVFNDFDKRTGFELECFGRIVIGENATISDDLLRSVFSGYLKYFGLKEICWEEFRALRKYCIDSMSNNSMPFASLDDAYIRFMEKVESARQADNRKEALGIRTIRVKSF